MGILTSIAVDDIRRRGSIRDSDVAALRAAYETSSEITSDEADALFALHAATPIQDPSWTSLFIEVIGEFIVSQSEPEGYIVAENGRWLIDHITTFGRVETSTEMALLVHVLERARWSPPSLAAFALDQIRHAVDSGAGPLRNGRPIPRGTIAPAEVDFAARVLRAFGGDTATAVTRIEAEALLAIHRAIEPGGASPAWSELLVRTIGAGVLASLGHAVAPRSEIIESLGTPGTDGGLVSLLIGSNDPRAALPRHIAEGDRGGCRIWQSARVLSSEERALVRLERQRLEIVTNEVIEETDDLWLMDRLAESRPGDEAEATLLAYVVREASQLTDELERFAQRRAIAA
ncbi:MAG: hypothetical protein R3D44_01390 [Hyphomicrobiaceae bacterium]